MSENTRSEAVNPMVRGLLSYQDPRGSAFPDRKAPPNGTRLDPLSATRQAPPSATRHEPVRLVIPAHRDFLVLVRSAAAHLGVRIGLPAADVEDFRLAVDEACCLFLAGGPPAGPTLSCEFTEADGAVAVTVSAPVRGDFAGAQVGTFGWTLLQSLVDGLWWDAGAGRAEVRLLKRRRAGWGPTGIV